MRQTKAHRFVICVRNDDYPTSLETRKLYESLSDPDAAKHDQIRIIDESGEDYLYPASYFVPVELSKETERVLVHVT